MAVGILSAMTEEIDALVGELAGPTVRHAGMRAYHTGELWGRPAALAFSRWGKVAAATTATYLITHCGVDRVIFTGVAGGVDPGLRVGDVVIGTRLTQHDMDARPLFPRHEIPLLGTAGFDTDPAIRDGLLAAAAAFLGADFASAVGPDAVAEFHLDRPRAVAGAIASGDRFFAGREALDELRAALPDTACVEMEGAAVAQVCHEYGIPFGIVRTLSDAADEQAPVAFPRFVRDVARVYSHGILKHYLTGNLLGEWGS